MHQQISTGYRYFTNLCAATQTALVYAMAKGEMFDYFEFHRTFSKRSTGEFSLVISRAQQQLSSSLNSGEARAASCG